MSLQSLRSQVHYLEELPRVEDLQDLCDLPPASEGLLIYDKTLLNIQNYRKWADGFTKTYPVKGGEWLKSLENFPEHMKRIVELVPSFGRSHSYFLAVGGGTVGDFCGFIASTFKRGVPLISIPTTWLAAIDSAHGGKNALNLGVIKNQVGTFYPAKSVIVVKELLDSLPGEEVQGAKSELVKMALISGGDLYNQVWNLEELSRELLWELLPLAVEAKYQVVDKDPYEFYGERQVLNLGHTLGHAIEGSCGLSHGRAVGLGLWFALDWSLQRGLMDAHKHKNLSAILQRLLVFDGLAKESVRRQLNSGELRQLVGQDKKLSSERDVVFVFLEAEGRVLRQPVKVDELVSEAQRQGWVSH